MTVFEEQRLLDWKGITEDTCATQHNTRWVDWVFKLVNWSVSYGNVGSMVCL